MRGARGCGTCRALLGAELRRDATGEDVGDLAVLLEEVGRLDVRLRRGRRAHVVDEHDPILDPLAVPTDLRQHDPVLADVVLRDDRVHEVVDRHVPVGRDLDEPVGDRQDLRPLPDLDASVPVDRHVALQVLERVVDGHVLHAAANRDRHRVLVDHVDPLDALRDAADLPAVVVLLHREVVRLAHVGHDGVERRRPRVREAGVERVRPGVEGHAVVVERLEAHDDVALVDPHGAERVDVPVTVCDRLVEVVAVEEQQRIGFRLREARHVADRTVHLGPVVGHIAVLEPVDELGEVHVDDREEAPHEGDSVRALADTTCCGRFG